MKLGDLANKDGDLLGFSWEHHEDRTSGCGKPWLPQTTAIWGWFTALSLAHD